MKLSKLLKIFLIYASPFYCYSQQLSDIPAAVIQKANDYCISIGHINSYPDSYKFDLANRQQMDPSTIKVYKVEFSPRLFENNDENYNFYHFTGFCKVTFTHVKGVHYDSFRLPVNLDYKYNFVKRRPAPPEPPPDTNDYRNQCSGYTPPGYRRKKNCDLIYY